MLNYLSLQAARLLQRVDKICAALLGKNFPPPEAFCVATFEQNPLAAALNAPDKRKLSLNEIWNESILWAVPKHRRSVEKRLKRKFGWPDKVWKMFVVKTNLRVCNNCGKDYEVGVLCRHCYDKVKTETEQMQEKIQEELKLDPIEKEVIVLYDGEKNDHPELVNGKRVVEMNKPRPMWFSKNLMQKSTQQNTSSKVIKPDDLV